MINARIGVALHPFYRRQLSTAFGLKRVWFDEHGEQQTVPADPDARARGRVVARQRHYDEIVRLSESGMEPGCCAIKDARSVIDEHAGRRSSSGTYGSGAMAIPILLDCDPGHDDAVALLLAAADDAVDLAAVTTVAGNCPLDLATLNARRVAALAGLEGVPIAAGAAGPLHGELVTAPDIHGLTGLDGYDLRTGEAPLDPRRALELMSATLEDAPEPVTLVPTGPLTNVAQLLSTRPDLHGRIREIVLMGGSTGRGNTTPAAEFNIFVDPEAAAIVFGSGLPLTMIGLNLTHQARATTDVLARVRALPGEPARAVEGWMSFFGGRYERVHGEFAPPVHDPCTVAMLIDPSLIRCVDTFVAVETEGRWTRGATVVDLNGRLGQPPNARVAMELDAPRFWDLVIGALGRLGGADY